MRHVVDVVRPAFEEAFAYLRGGEDLRDGSGAALTSPTGRTSAFRHPGNVRCWRLAVFSVLSAKLIERPTGQHGFGLGHTDPRPFQSYEAMQKAVAGSAEKRDI